MYAFELTRAKTVADAVAFGYCGQHPAADVTHANGRGIVAGRQHTAPLWSERDGQAFRVAVGGTPTGVAPSAPTRSRTG